MQSLKNILLGATSNYLSSMNMVGMGQGKPDQIRRTGNTLEEIQQRFHPAKGLIDVYNLG